MTGCTTNGPRCVRPPSGRRGGCSALYTPSTPSHASSRAHRAGTACGDRATSAGPSRHMVDARLRRITGRAGASCIGRHRSAVRSDPAMSKKRRKMRYTRCSILRIIWRSVWRTTAAVSRSRSSKQRLATPSGETPRTESRTMPLSWLTRQGRKPTSAIRLLTYAWLNDAPCDKSDRAASDPNGSKMQERWPHASLGSLLCPCWRAQLARR